MLISQPAWRNRYTVSGPPSHANGRRGVVRTGTQNHTSHGTRTRPLLVLVGILGLLVPSVVFAQSPSTPPPQAEEVDLTEPELEFMDMLFTQKPTQDNEIEFGYRFERQKTDLETGTVINHASEISAGFGVRITDWLGLSFEIPYQINDQQTTDPATGAQVQPDTRNIGDVMGQVLITFWKDPDRQFALAGGLEVGFPTGSFQDGTGEGWSLSPFLSVGKLFGSFQVLGNLGYSANLKQPGEGEERGQQLFYNLAFAYPFFDKRLIPFFEVNGVYVFQGEAELRHRGQVYLSPGIRINPWGDVHGHGGHEHSHGHNHGNGDHPWYERLSLAVGAQFPVTAAREFEWALAVQLKLEF